VRKREVEGGEFGDERQRRREPARARLTGLPDAHAGDMTPAAGQERGRMFGITGIDYQS
jgi:hypothetical protein